jgi:thioredoxin 1
LLPDGNNIKSITGKMNTTLIIIIAVFSVLAILFFSLRAKIKNTPPVKDSEKIITLTDKNFQHQINAKTILVDFWASWCAPCRMMAPVLNEVSEEIDKVFVGKINIDEYQSVAAKYNVRNIPTMIIFKNGKEVDRIVGIKSKSYLLQQINRIK